MYQFNVISVQYRSDFDGLHDPSFILFDNGNCFLDQEGQEPSMMPLSPDDTFWLFELANTYLKHPLLLNVDDATDWMSIRVIGHDGNGKIVFGGNEGIEVIRIPGNEFYHEGNDVRDHFVSLEEGIRFPYGSEMMAFLLDMAIPPRYSPAALALLREGFLDGDERIRKEGDVLVNFFLDQKTGLPPMTEALKEYILSRAEQYRYEIGLYLSQHDDIDAAEEGMTLMFRMKKGKEEAAHFAEYMVQRNSPKGYYHMGSMFSKSEDEALGYFVKGMELGHQRCAISAAKIYIDRGDAEAAYEALGQAIKIPDGEAFAMMASAYMEFNYVQKPKGENPFKDPNAHQIAFDWAIKGVQLRSVHAMRICARMWLEGMPDDSGEVARQWLEIAVRHDDVEALPLLADYYSKDHPQGVQKDLARAETLIKQAILKKDSDYEGMQIIYANILKQQGRTEEAERLLQEVKGN